MSSFLFPEFDYDHEKKLFIIGNGFDISHGLNTEWADYLDWLSLQDKYSSLYNWLIFDPGLGATLWSNLEKALGEFDIKDMYNFCTQYIKIDYDHMMRTEYAFEDAPGIELPPLITLLRSSLFDWIQHIVESKLPVIHRHYLLPEQAHYLSFNYTPVLEVIYGIPASQINHIHGHVNDPCHDLIVGHNVTRKPEYEDDSMTFINNAKEAICRIMNELNKNVPAVIAANADYFASLYNIEYITILGHSYNSIDMPYFQAIKNVVTPQCRWEFSWHTEGDKVNADAMIATLGIDPDVCSFAKIGE
ncbi:MAG: bacteriophage abortive infection AbiH family protein [Bacteroidales bacterium]|nr:bacteriophage abortive infection AbiH family protein [Bacteroidales bacterium]